MVVVVVVMVVVSRGKVATDGGGGGGCRRQCKIVCLGEGPRGWGGRTGTDRGVLLVGSFAWEMGQMGQRQRLDVWTNDRAV